MNNLDVEDQRYFLCTAKQEAEAVSEWVAKTHGEFCVYCGELAKDQDHLLPEPYTGLEMRKEVPTVPSCSSCNGILGDLVEPIIKYRCCFISRHLRKKHGDDIEKYRKGYRKRWDEDQLNELGHVLQSKVRAGIYKFQSVLDRISFLELGGACMMEPESFVHDKHE